VQQRRAKLTSAHSRAVDLDHEQVMTMANTASLKFSTHVLSASRSS
jgi:hypothetical protein